MNAEPELRLPPDILADAKMSGNEFGWKHQDIRRTLEAAESVGLAVVGGQVQFVIPGGTCELYWQNFDASVRLPDEDWFDYVGRAHREVRAALERLPSPLELVQDGVDSFEFLRLKRDEGVKLEDHLLYVCYFRAEDPGSP